MKNILMQRAKIYYLFSIVSILCAAIGVYGHSLGNDFQMKWDDQWMVFNNYTATFSYQNMVNILTEFYKGQYSPLNQLLYSLIHRIWGYDPFAFHAVSLLLHAGCAWLVFSIIRSIANWRIAWGVAMLFTIHPLQVETVAWISASKILIYSFFYLAAIRFYIQYVRKGNTIYYLFTFICFILSFGGKEQAVTLPVCLLVFDGILKRDFKSYWLWQEKIPFFLLAFFFAYITLSSHASRGLGLLTAREVYPFYQRIAFGAYAYTEYIVKTILPVNLMFVYYFPMGIGMELPFRFWLYPAGWVAVFAIFYKYWLKTPIFYGMIYYTILIALTIQIVPMERTAIVADRYIYLALPGILFIMAYYVDYWVQQLGHKKKWLIGGVLVYFLVLGCYAHSRTYAWESSETLKSRLLELLKQKEGVYE